MTRSTILHGNCTSGKKHKFLIWQMLFWVYTPLWIYQMMNAQQIKFMEDHLMQDLSVSEDWLSNAIHYMEVVRNFSVVGEV